MVLELFESLSNPTRNHLKQDTLRWQHLSSPTDRASTSVLSSHSHKSTVLPLSSRSALTGANSAKMTINFIISLSHSHVDYDHLPIMEINLGLEFNKTLNYRTNGKLKYWPSFEKPTSENTTMHIDTLLPLLLEMQNNRFTNKFSLPKVHVI